MKLQADPPENTIKEGCSLIAYDILRVKEKQMTCHYDKLKDPLYTL